MKEKIINLIIACDMQSEGVLSSRALSPSSSIEEIAEHMSNYLEKAENKING